MYIFGLSHLLPPYLSAKSSISFVLTLTNDLYFLEVDVLFRESFEGFHCSRHVHYQHGSHLFALRILPC